MSVVPFLRWALAAALAGNALAMLLRPSAWYATVPGVAETGALNPHFVRDIGAAYFVSAAGLLWRAWQPRPGWAAAMAGAGFLLLHALVHVGEMLAGLCGWNRLAADLPGVVLPALLAFALAWPPRQTREARA
jgi:hypothetical protein